MNNVYIIHSCSLNKYYIGSTTLTVEERLAVHNAREYHHSYTSQAQDWEIHFKIRCRSNSQALKIEKHIKRMKSRVYIQNLVEYPEIAKKLLERYS